MDPVIVGDPIFQSLSIKIENWYLACALFETGR